LFIDTNAYKILLFIETNAYKIVLLLGTNAYKIVKSEPVSPKRTRPEEKRDAWQL
jgi:hypothetical protein